jgi:thiamine-monophosphate kinase
LVARLLNMSGQNHKGSGEVSEQERGLKEFMHTDLTLAAMGEKEVIRRIIRPLFNPNKDQWSVGDDCALIDVQDGMAILVSTDRVPADLTSFRLGILDHRGLGRYLARLNLSDIAASGGTPRGLLLNLGLPSNYLVRDLLAMLLGALDVAEQHGCGVIGGDLSDSRELSISATAIGQVERSRALSRQTAKRGDLVFTSRPIGLTPAAFHYHRHRSRLEGSVSPSVVHVLNGQFLEVGPMFDLAAILVASGQCSSCMDNTDGIGQSLSEIAENSGVSIVVNAAELQLPKIVQDLATESGQDEVRFALGAGADFSLVGTISESALRGLQAVAEEVAVIGRVEAGTGVHLRVGSQLAPLVVEGWNYYLE